MTTSGERTWRNWAPCRYVDPEFFFPAGDERGNASKPVSKPVQAQLDKAKAFCRTAGPGGSLCPVLVECLEDALRVESYSSWGVRGGLDPNERIAVLRRRARARLAARRAVEEIQERTAS